MAKRYDLIPTGEKAEQVIDFVLSVFSKSKVSLKECLDTDARALCANDMRYFPREWYMKVPSYGLFMSYMNRLPADVKDNFNEIVAEIEGSECVGTMKEIATGGDYSRESQVKFGMFHKLNGVYEKRLDRIDRRRKDRGDGEARGVDLAAKLISALSNADLLNVKAKAETIDAEFREE